MYSACHRPSLVEKEGGLVKDKTRKWEEIPRGSFLSTPTPYIILGDETAEPAFATVLTGRLPLIAGVAVVILIFIIFFLVACRVFRRRLRWHLARVPPLADLLALRGLFVDAVRADELPLRCTVPDVAALFPRADALCFLRFGVFDDKVHQLALVGLP